MHLLHQNKLSLNLIFYEVFGSPLVYLGEKLEQVIDDA